VPDGVSHLSRRPGVDSHQFLDHRQNMFLAVLVSELLRGREERNPVAGSPSVDRLREQTPL
jgi:hypothetical protein